MLNQYGSIWELAASIIGLSKTVLWHLSLQTYDTVEQMLDSSSPLGFNISETWVFKMNVVTIGLCKHALIYEFLLNFYLYFTLSQAWIYLIFMSWVLLYFLSTFSRMSRYFIDYITTTPACCTSQQLLNLHGWEKERGRKRTSSDQFRSLRRPHNGAMTQYAIWMKGRKKDSTTLSQQVKEK